MVSSKYADIGVLLCWDQWFPEAARLTAMLGAEIIFYPTAIGYLPRESEMVHIDKLHAWQSMLKGHAVANSCFVACTNRVGFEKTPGSEEGINFWGQSFAVNPDGVVLAQGSKDQEEIIMCSLDLDLVDVTKNNFSFPYRDRRIDSYNDLLKLYSD